MAYLEAGLAGVFLSTGLARFGLDSPELEGILKWVLGLVAVGVATLFLAAAVEATVSPLLVGWLSG
jgi:uncharacterized membrane protein SpoIIM required for sporulation